MIQYFKTSGSGTLEEIDQPVRGCWISVVSPTQVEKQRLLDEFLILPEFLRAALDEEESSYIDRSEDDNQTLVIIDYPEKDQTTRKSIETYITLPMGVVLLDKMIMTISTRENSTIESLIQGKVKDLDTRYKTRFLLQLILLISQEYLSALRLIDRFSNQTEQKLYKHMSNSNLIDMLVLEKSLIYFSTSLKALEQTLRRILRSRQIPMYESDRGLLDDVLIEVKQGIEMCEIYSDVMDRSADGFTNVINNNMNIIMKRLTVITLVLSIPNMVYGFYGMNVTGLPWPMAWVPLLISILLCLFAWLYFRHSSSYK